MSEEDTANGAAKSKDDAANKGQGAKTEQKDAKTANATAAKTEDAVTSLKNDHRKVEGLFDQYQQASRRAEKQKLARQICQELIVHTKLEEEIFYAACREAGVEDDALDEAQVEHDGAKVLINELLGGSPEQPFYDAKVKVLAEEIKHHVNEEEKRDGIFAKAKASGLDLEALGQKLAARKAELLEQVEQNGLERPRPRSFTQRGTETAMPQGQYRDRDDRGRFMGDDDDDRRYSRSSRSSGGSRYDDDDDRRYSSRASDRDRDENGRFTSDDDRRFSSSRRGYDDDDRRSGGSRGASPSRDRDDRGRFMSEDDDNRGGYRTRSYGRDDDDDRRSSSGRGGQSRERDDRGRFTSDDDDDRRSYSSRSSGSSRGSRYEDDNDGDGRGWYGDSEGHSQAARRGWEDRQGGRRSMSARGNGGRGARDDDDDRGNGRSRRNSGHGGWFGDSEGHSEAARRGWEGR